MSRNPGRVAGRSVSGAVVVAAIAAGRPEAVAAHAIGGTFQLPVPLGLYLAGAAIAVAASFVVAAIRTQKGDTTAASTGTPIRTSLATAVRWTLRVLGLVWWYGAILVGFLVADITLLPGVLLWIGLWVGLPIVAIVLGNPWPSLSPFRTTWGAIDALARRAGAAHGIDLGLAYPRGLGRWVAVALLAAGVWAELVLPGSDAATTVAWLLVVYTAVTLLGMTAFGQIAWLRNAEIFEVELGWFGRIGPIGRVAADPELCRGCSEACDPDRCVDCPECAVAADDDERRPVLRAPLSGLRDVGHPTVADAAFIVLLLAGVTFDGLAETTVGGVLAGAIYPPVIATLGPTSLAILLADTIAYVTVVVAFGIAFALVIVLSRALGLGRRGGAAGTSSGTAAATLLPIAGGYLVAHYLTLVIQGVIWLPTLIRDPRFGIAPALDWIPTALVWYVSVVAIVGGHIAAIALAHRLAVRDAPARATRAGLPMLVLMIGYTVLSLWIIAQPIVIDPGVQPAAGV